MEKKTRHTGVEHKINFSFIIQVADSWKKPRTIRKPNSSVGAIPQK